MAKYDRLKIQKILARNILYHMGENGMSVTELAVGCDVTVSSMKQLLAGLQFVSSRTLATICEVLHVTPDMLFVDRGDDEEIDVAAEG